MQHGKGIAREQTVFLETVQVLTFLFFVKTVICRVSAHIGAVDDQCEADLDGLGDIYQIKIGRISSVAC